MDVTKACESFRILLEEQLNRIANINTEKVDFSTKKCVTIGIVDGDGIGPVIMASARQVLETLLADEIAAGSVILKNIEGLTIENRLAQGKPVPEDVLAQIKACDVLLKGPTTTPMGGKMESANVTLRRELDLYANCRPRVHSGGGHRLDVLPGKYGGRVCAGQPGRGIARYGSGFQGHHGSGHPPHRPCCFRICTQ